MEDFITPKEVASLKGVSLQAVYKAIDRGSLPAVRIFNRLVIRIQDVDIYRPHNYSGTRSVQPSSSLLHQEARLHGHL